MNPTLTYSITTNPFPLQASASSGNPNIAQLTIVATNNSGSDVTLQGMMVQIPIGQLSNQLTNDSADIGPVAPANWQKPQVQTPTGYVQYAYLPQPGYGTVKAGESLNFVFNNIQVNSQTGQVEIDVTEGSNNCTPGVNCPIQQLYITKFPNSWGQVSFWVDSPIIPLGGSITLHWSGPTGATYSIQYYDWQHGVIVNVPAQGAPPLSNDGIYPSQTDPPLKPQQTTIFTLNVSATVSGQTYQAQTQLTVTVDIPAPVVNSFMAVPPSVNIFQPSNVKLQWSTTNASVFDIAGVGSFQGSQAANGSTVVAPSGTTQYFANAYGMKGYSGPPVSANTWVNFMGSATSPYIDVWNQPQSGVDWTLDLYHGLNSISLYLSVEDNPSGKYREVVVALPGGVQIADLGTAGPNAGYNAVINGQYGTSVPNATLYIGVGEYDSEQLQNVGATWGVKFNNGRYALLWFQSGASDGGYIFDDKWAFTFGWILYGALDAADTKRSSISNAIRSFFKHLFGRKS